MRAELLACVLVLVIAFPYLPSRATGTAPMQVPTPSFSTWSTQVSKVHLPGIGCFQAKYPNMTWQKVQCVKPPNIPHPPATVGGGGAGSDWVASSTTLIWNSVGSFSSVNRLKSEKDNITGANYYTLQINTEPWQSPWVECFFNLPPTPDTCNWTTLKRWEQFIYENDPGSNQGNVFIEWWVFGTSCPPPGDEGDEGWTPYSGHGISGCYIDSGSAPTPLTAATDLAKISLYSNTVAVEEGGPPGGPDLDGIDGVDACNAAWGNGVCYGSTLEITDHYPFCPSWVWVSTPPGTGYWACPGMYPVNNDEEYLYKNWYDSEFNVFGWGGGSEAIFNSGASLNVVNSVTDSNGNPLTPTCLATRYTGETNNFNVGNCSAKSGYITFYESTGKEYSLTMKVRGPGTVTPGSGSYGSGSEVTITATPNPGHVFKEWKGKGAGSYTGNEASVIITINADITETAIFQ